MSPIVPPRRPIVLKTSRDTLLLLAATIAATLAIGYSAHNRAAVETRQQSGQSAAGDWAGQLAALEPGTAATATPSDSMSSEALTVPKTSMALPATPRAPAKPRQCDTTACLTNRASNVATGSVHRVAASARSHPIREASLVDRFNPLNHLPDMVKRPFAAAGDTIADWVRRF